MEFGQLGRASCSSVEASTTIPEQEQEVDQSPNDVEAEGTDENPVKEEPLESEKVNEVAKDTVLNSIAFLSKKCASLSCGKNISG